MEGSRISGLQLFRQQCLVGGSWCDADDGATTTIFDPGNGEAIGAVPMMGASETQRAVAAAEAALPGWRARTAADRARIMRRLHDLMLAERDELARLLTREQGKPLTEAEAEIAYAASFIEWFAEEGKRAYGEVIPSPLANKRIVTLMQGVGVVAAITPWNFPSAMITRKLGPALAAGCTVVLKPAPATPFSALALAALAEAAGLPAGLFNVVTGDAVAIGGELTGNPAVRKLTFTGSTEVGRLLSRACADTVKKVSLELGGNAPFIVFDDADIDAAVDGAVASKFRNCGQTCVCTNRFYVQDAVYDEFAAKLAERVTKLKVGYGLEPETQVGPLINHAAVAKVEQHLKDAIAGGARILAGGTRDRRGGLYFQPTVLADVGPKMRIAREETFGPLAGVIRFRTEAEAIELANATEMGLASYFYSRDIGRVWRIAEALETGIVGINTGLISTEVAPFGGVKQSGLGREGSRHGLSDYMEIKYLCIAL